MFVVVSKLSILAFTCIVSLATFANNLTCLRIIVDFDFMHTLQFYKPKMHVDYQK